MPCRAPTCGMLPARRISGSEELRRRPVSKGPCSKQKELVLKKAKAERKMLIMKMPNSFSPAQLGDHVMMKSSHMSKATLKNRIECLERVMLLSPTLPFAERVCWPSVRDACCTRCRYVWTTCTGSKFQNEVNLMVHEMGTHYGGYARSR